MDGQAKLQATAIAIGIAVIAAMVAAFVLLFYFYSRERRKVIGGGLADREADAELEGIRQKVLKKLGKRPSVEGSGAGPEVEVAGGVVSYVFPEEGAAASAPLSYSEALSLDKKRRRSLSIIGDVVYSLFAALMLGLAAFGIACAASGSEPAFFGDSAMLVVMTGSMEEAYEGNAYLQENGLEDRIEQYSLITIDRVSSASEVDLYDVIAFYDYDGNVIVHRVISFNGDGTLRTRGDANSSSAAYELYVGDERLVGVWTGWQSFGLGVATAYLRSTLGIIALVGAGAFLAAYCVAEDRIEKSWDERLAARAEALDGGGGNNPEHIDGNHRLLLIQSDEPTEKRKGKKK